MACKMAGHQLHFLTTIYESGVVMKGQAGTGYISYSWCMRLPALSKLLVRIRRIVWLFHRSTVSVYQLEEKQNLLGLLCHKLITVVSNDGQHWPMMGNIARIINYPQDKAENIEETFERVVAEAASLEVRVEDEESQLNRGHPHHKGEEPKPLPSQYKTYPLFAKPLSSQKGSINLNAPLFLRNKLHPLCWRICWEMVTQLSSPSLPMLKLRKSFVVLHHFLSQLFLPTLKSPNLSTFNWELVKGVPGPATGESSGSPLLVSFKFPVLLSPSAPPTFWSSDMCPSGTNSKALSSSSSSSWDENTVLQESLLLSTEERRPLPSHNYGPSQVWKLPLWKLAAPMSQGQEGYLEGAQADSMTRETSSSSEKRAHMALCPLYLGEQKKSAQSGTAAGRRHDLLATCDPANNSLSDSCRQKTKTDGEKEKRKSPGLAKRPLPQKRSHSRCISQPRPSHLHNSPQGDRSSGAQHVGKARGPAVLNAHPGPMDEGLLQQPVQRALLVDYGLITKVHSLPEIEVLNPPKEKTSRCIHKRHSLKPGPDQCRLNPGAYSLPTTTGSTSIETVSVESAVPAVDRRSGGATGNRAPAPAPPPGPGGSAPPCLGQALTVCPSSPQPKHFIPDE
ncbi:hypothetical protein FQN60_018727, partial [Etheostoma spectabile]